MTYILVLQESGKLPDRMLFRDWQTAFDVAEHIKETGSWRNTFVNPTRLQLGLVNAFEVVNAYERVDRDEFVWICRVSLDEAE